MQSVRYGSLRKHQGYMDSVVPSFFITGNGYNEARREVLGSKFRQRAQNLSSITVVINFDWILVILKSSENFNPYI